MAKDRAAGSPAPHELARTVVTLPRVDRPLPTPSDFARVAACPIVQLIVAGRSGSAVLHAFLDGHPQIVHVPHTFKYYDFIACHPGVLSRPPGEIVATFAAWPAAQLLFDSSASVILGGRLGDALSTYIRYDLDRFREAFLAAIAGADVTERHVFLALVTAFAWCAGQDLSRATVVLHHLHHGDWVWPERLLDRSNIACGGLPPDRTGALRADKYLIPIRAPYDTYVAHTKFASRHGLSETARLDLEDQLVRLLFQDWDRLAAARREGCDVHVVRLEDLRGDAGASVAACARWLGIDPDHESLRQLTFYGYPWHGDVFTEPSPVVHRTRPSRKASWQERWLCDVAVGREAIANGYPMGRNGRVKWWLLGLSAWWPAPGLFDTSIQDAGARRAAARVRSQARRDFAGRLWRRWTK